MRQVVSIPYFVGRNVFSCYCSENIPAENFLTWLITLCGGNTMGTLNILA